MSLELELISSITPELTAAIWEKLKPIFLKPDDFKLDKEIVKSSLKGKPNYIQELSNAHKVEDLVFILGAGASAEYDLPSWNQLLQKLFVKTLDKSIDQAVVLSKIFSNLFTPNPLIIGRYLQNYYEGKGLQFEKAVRDILYENIDDSKETKLLDEIIKFCVAPGKSSNLNSIITYNYDDLIETKIRKLGIGVPIKEIYGIGIKPKSGELPIYHVHGYLPRKGKLTKSNQITLGENIYHKQYSEIYSWNNITQINKFRDNSCLFIGVSLTDPNMRRLLDIARVQRGEDKAYHFTFKKRYNIAQVKKNLEKILENNELLLNEKSRANLKFEEASKIMIDLIEEFEENDFLSLGVNTIWIDNYDEIPKILEKIRTK